MSLHAYLCTSLWLFPHLSICVFSKLNVNSYWCLRLESSTTFFLTIPSCLSLTSHSSSEKPDSHHPSCIYVFSPSIHTMLFHNCLSHTSRRNKFTSYSPMFILTGHDFPELFRSASLPPTSSVKFFHTSVTQLDSYVIVFTASCCCFRFQTLKFCDMNLWYTFLLLWDIPLLKKNKNPQNRSRLLKWASAKAVSFYENPSLLEVFLYHLSPRSTCNDSTFSPGVPWKYTFTLTISLKGQEKEY